jgi:ribosomal protein L28
VEEKFSSCRQRQQFSFILHYVLSVSGYSHEDSHFPSTIALILSLAVHSKYRCENLRLLTHSHNRTRYFFTPFLHKFKHYVVAAAERKVFFVCAENFHRISLSEGKVKRSISMCVCLCVSIFFSNSFLCKIYKKFFFYINKSSSKKGPPVENYSMSPFRFFQYLFVELLLLLLLLLCTSLDSRKKRIYVEATSYQIIQMNLFFNKTFISHSLILLLSTRVAAVNRR